MQSWKWITGSRAERGSKVFFETQADRADSKKTQADLKRLQESLGDLKAIARSLARQMHLEQRKADLETALGRSWDEYRAVIFELGQPGRPLDLPPELVEVLEREIEPKYRTDQKERRRTYRLLLVLVAAFVLPLPFTPSSVIYLAAIVLSAAFVYTPR